MPVGKRVLSTSPESIWTREYTRKLHALGLCRCGSPIANGSKSRCFKCIQSNKDHYRKIRDRVLKHYGNKCVCCGISENKFLAMDHVNGNGNQHRLSICGHKKMRIHSWLIKNNFPDNFQILCHNCNMAKGIYGVCPHRENKQVGI